MSIYTHILEFQGGTYIAQIDAPNEYEAGLLWCQQLVAERVLGAKSISGAKAIRRSIEESGLTPISGTVGVWYMAALFSDKLVYAHIISTRGAKRTRTSADRGAKATLIKSIL
jgi:hypothetical protein